MVEVTVKLLLAAELFENSSVCIQTIKVYLLEMPYLLPVLRIGCILILCPVQFLSFQCFMTSCLWISRLLGSLR